MYFELHLLKHLDLTGVGFQRSSEEGLPERSDALWDAASGCLHNPVAGQRLAWQIREGVQVSFSSFSGFSFNPFIIIDVPR